MRAWIWAALLALPLACNGCAAAKPKKPPTLDQILQDEGANPTDVPMYLMGKDGTFITNGLMPTPWGDTF